MCSDLRRLLIVISTLGAATWLPCSVIAQQPSSANTQGITIAPSSFERVGSGPTIFFRMRDGLNGIIDTLANSVVFVDEVGRIVRRTALPETFVVSGTEAHDDRVLLLSSDRRSAITLQRSVDATTMDALREDPLPPSARVAPALSVRRSKTQLSIGSPPGPGRTSGSSLEVRSLSGGALADAVEVGSNSTGDRYVLWSEFVSANPDIVVRGFVGRYRRDGRLTGVAELPIAEMDYVPEEYVVVTGDGDVTVMVPTRTNIQLRVIPIQAIPAIDPMTRSNIVSPETLRRLPAVKGRVIEVVTQLRAPQDAVEPRNLQFPAKEDREGRAFNPITRAQVLELARAFVTQEWTLSKANYEQPGFPDACNKAQRQYWSRPSWVRETSIDQSMTRIPYKWGGFDNPTEFVRQIGQGLLAGSVCTCRDPSHNDCVVDKAAGVDCSGFVSRAWGQVRKYGTSGLGAISTLVKGWQSDLGRLKPGDALNRAGSHVRLVIQASSTPQIKIVVLESTTARSCKRLDGTVTACEGVCECARSIAEFNGYQLLRYKGIQD